MKTNVIHVKFDYNESQEARKKILYSEIYLIQTLKSIKNFSDLRKEELKLKVKLNQKINELAGSLKKLKEQLPNSQLPQALRKKEEIKTGIKEKLSYDKGIESELASIRAKLKELE